MSSRLVYLGLWMATAFAGDIILDMKSKDIQRAIDGLSPKEMADVEEWISNIDRCTTIAVGPGATVDGSSMNTYNADCADCDWRVNKVPAKDWAPGSLRPVYRTYSPYPARVRNDRGETWRVDNLEHIPQRETWKTYPPSQTILGYIPQVNHTYALFEGMYSIMNEHQVGMGESTCAAKLFAPPAGFGNGTALLEINELSQIALERSRTAREAIQTMGDLAMQYGYYSSTWDVSRLPEILQVPMLEGEGGEALTVIDPYEAWMFHIMPDDTGKAAVWVAQRVPDDHITVCANTFVIREVDPDSEDFMYSSNLWSVAKKKGWWHEDMGKLDFLKTYAPQRYHPNYSTKRVWSVFHHAAPSLNLPFNTDAWGDAYPFSVKVEKNISHLDLFNYSRDYYQGTSFDTNKGRAGGPYGDPARWDPGAWGNMTVWDTLQGEFPRTINLFRTSYSTVNQARRHVPDFLALSWIAMYATDQSVYTPVYVNSRELPKEYTVGTMQKYNTTSAWWNTCVVGNYVSRFYNFAIAAVRETQRYFESQSAADNAALEKKVMAVLKQHGVKTRFEEDQAHGNVEASLDSTGSDYSEHSNWLDSSDSSDSTATSTDSDSDKHDRDKATSRRLGDKHDDAETKKADSGDSDKKKADSGDSDKKKADSGDADKNKADSGDSDKKKADSGDSDKKKAKSSDSSSSSGGSSSGDGSIQDLIKRAEEQQKKSGSGDSDKKKADSGDSDKKKADSDDSDKKKAKSSDSSSSSGGSSSGDGTIQDLIKRAEEQQKKSGSGDSDKKKTDSDDSDKKKAKSSDSSSSSGGSSSGDGSIQDLIKRAEEQQKKSGSGDSDKKKADSGDSDKKKADSGDADSSSSSGGSIQDLIKRAEEQQKKSGSGDKDDSLASAYNANADTMYGSSDKAKKSAQDDQYHKHRDDDKRDANTEKRTQDEKKSEEEKKFENEKKSSDDKRPRDSDEQKKGGDGKKPGDDKKGKSTSSSSDSTGDTGGEPAFVKKLIDEIKKQYGPKASESWQDQLVDDLTNHTVTYGRLISESYRDLLPVLFTTYRDGFVMNMSSVSITFDHMFYPMWWLNFVGYFDNKPNDKGIFFAANPNGDSPIRDELGSSSSAADVLGSFASVLGLAMLGYAGFVVGKRYEERSSGTA